MIVSRNFFNSRLNRDGRPASKTLRLSADPTVVEDPVTGRMWTRGCIDDLPASPSPTHEEELALFDPKKQAQVTEKANAAAMRMWQTIQKMVARANHQHFGGYDGWHLPTLEEAMSLMTKDVQRGLHIDALFSNHLYVRTCDFSYHNFGLGGAMANGFRTVWVVNYGDADTQEIPAQARVPCRLVRSTWDH